MNDCLKNIFFPDILKNDYNVIKNNIIIENLKADFLWISKWFHENFMVLNPNKCRFMVLGNSNFTCDKKW